MLIVRSVFTLDGTGSKEYFFDRAYDESKSEQENCDLALTFLVGAVKDKEAIAVVSKAQNNMKPVIVNLANVLYITVTAIGIYKSEPKTDEVKAEVVE